MKHLTVALLALGLITVALTYLVAARPAKATAAEKTPALGTRAAVVIQRLVYRNFGDHEPILAEHSVATVGTAAACAGTSSA